MGVSWVDKSNGNGYCYIGVDFNYHEYDTYITIAPIIYRWDSCQTDNYGGTFDEELKPDPIGNGAWYGARWGETGPYQDSDCVVDTFSTRTYYKGKSTSWVNLDIIYHNLRTYRTNYGMYTCNSDIDRWSVAVPTLQLYTIQYDANQGSGAPSSQTKWHGESITISSNIPTREGYTFKGWATSSTAIVPQYNGGSSYSANANATLYAVWEEKNITLSYDINGKSSSSIPSQIINYTLDLIKISDIIPVYNDVAIAFKGWSKTQYPVYEVTDTLPSLFNSGSSYSKTQLGINQNNFQNITLYAVWQKTHSYPILSTPSFKRLSYIEPLTEEKTYTTLQVSFSWEIFQGYNVSYCKLYYKESGALSWEDPINIPGVQGNSGNIVYQFINGTTQNPRVDEKKSYILKIEISDNDSSGLYITSSTEITLPASFKTLYFKKGGKGVGVGTIVEDSEMIEGETEKHPNGLFKVGMDMFLPSNIYQYDGNDYKEIGNLNTLPPGMIYPYAAPTIKEVEGEIVSNIPTGFLLCNGEEVLINDYRELYNVIDDTWGKAETGYFKLPDLSERFIFGASKNNNDYKLTDTGGLDEVTLNINQIPAHAHTILSNAKELAQTSGGTAGFGIEANRSTTTGKEDFTSISRTGGGESHENMPPYTVLNYIISTGKNYKPINEQFSSESPLSVTRGGTGVSSFSSATFSGATSSTNGAAGFVPAPLSGDNTKFLKGDGTWADSSGLPAITSQTEAGSFLMLNSSKEPIWNKIANANGVSF